MPAIGIIGVGNIGSHFAKVLRQANCGVTVLDLDREKMEAAAALGATAAASPGEVAERSEVILLCLPGSPAVEAVMEGPEGILSHLRPGQLIIDTGTTHPETDIRYEKLCRQKGAGLVDAPITWRSEGLIVMVGGEGEDFERARPVLSLLSWKLKHIGPIGQGQALKLANQMVLAAQWATWSEAVTWAEKAGLDPRLLREHLGFPIDERLFGDDFGGGGTLRLHYKDLGYVLDLSHRWGAHIPLTNVAHEAFKTAAAGGDADWAPPGIVIYWRRLNEQS